MNNIEGKTENLGKLFSVDYFFRIPYYQRPFAWEEENFEKLIDDVMSAAAGQQYFLGTLVLHKKDEKNNYDVVDGQQRLTSLIILLACLRDMISDADFSNQLHDKIIQAENKVDGVPAKPRIEVKDRKMFDEMVLTRNGTKTKKRPGDLAEPENRYMIAINTFYSKLDGKSQEYLQKLSQLINQKCVIIQLSTTSFDDAFKLFTIVNDRGKQLRRIDIIKAQNISPDIVPIDATRDKLAQEWESIEKALGENAFESLFHSIRLIYLKEKPQEDLYNEFEKKIYGKGLLEQGEKFVNLLTEYGNLYQSIFIDKDMLDEEDKEDIVYKSLVHIMNQEFEASEWKTCLMFYAKKFSTASFYKFVLHIEKIYLLDWVKGVRKDERFGTYSNILKVIEKSTKADEVFLSLPIDNSDIIKATKAQAFYNASFAKYLLLRLELLASEHDAYKEFSAKSIEHIFPQTIKAGSSWSKDPDVLEHADIVNNIGNLVLLSKGKNSSASNNDFDTKKEKYLKSRVTDYPRSVQILAEPDWTIAKIKVKNEEIAKMILNDPKT